MKKELYKTFAASMICLVMMYLGVNYVRDWLLPDVSVLAEVGFYVLMVVVFFYPLLYLNRKASMTY